jgi:hypothetical protein
MSMIFACWIAHRWPLWLLAITAFRTCCRMVNSSRHSEAAIGASGPAVLLYSRCVTTQRSSASTRTSNRFLAVQVWEWDGDQYDLRIYLTSESPDGICETQMLRSRYYAVSIERLMSLLAEAGFVGGERRDDALSASLVGSSTICGLIRRSPWPPSRRLNSSVIE